MLRHVCVFAIFLGFAILAIAFAVVVEFRAGSDHSWLSSESACMACAIRLRRSDRSTIDPLPLWLKYSCLEGHCMKPRLAFILTLGSNATNEKHFTYTNYGEEDSLLFNP